MVVAVPLEGHGESVVRWAAAEARERGLPLRLVLALAVPRGSYPGRSIVGIDMGTGLHAMAQRELGDMRRVANETAPGLAVSEDVIESGAVAVLRAQARTASLVVIGNDGLPRRDAARVGSGAGVTARRQSRER